MPNFKWLGLDKAVPGECAVPELELHAREADARMADAMKGFADPAEYDRATCTVMIDNVIRDPRRLRVEAGADPLPYFYTVACVKDGLKGDLSMPPARGGGGADEHRAGRRGSRRRILPVHMPFLLLHAARSGNPLEMLESKFGMDQAAISRYIRMTLAILTDPGKMPTAVAVAGEIGDAPMGEVVEAIGRAINCDATESRIEAPRDAEANGKAFSGRA